MPEDAPPNGGGPPERAVGAYRRVSEMQAKQRRRELLTLTGVVLVAAIANGSIGG